jgi:hypothetical protein
LHKKISFNTWNSAEGGKTPSPVRSENKASKKTTLEEIMTKQTKYAAYCYWCAKQGLNALTYNAWLSTEKKGKLA